MVDKGEVNLTAGSEFVKRLLIIKCSSFNFIEKNILKSEHYQSVRLYTTPNMKLVREFDISQRKVNHIPPYGGFSGQRTGIHHAKLLPISFAALRSLHPNIHDTSLQVIVHLLTALCAT